ncbi:MAG: hypothetical protein GXO63_02845 [Candidatus Micrarchaeota archaeon]|nr:hypothetical protein [Candidatus Micrarchaeota archaeon]
MSKAFVITLTALVLLSAVVLSAIAISHKASEAGKKSFLELNYFRVNYIYEDLETDLEANLTKRSVGLLKKAVNVYSEFYPQGFISIENNLVINDPITGMRRGR